MFSKHKNILIVLVLIVISFFAYWYFVLSKKDTAQTRNVSTGGLVKSNDSSASSASSTEQLKLDRQFVNGILTLNSVKIDVGLFKTPAFQALNYPDKPFDVDYKLPVGRENPFLPIGVNAKQTASSDVQQVILNATTTNQTSTSTATTTRSQAPVQPSRVNR